MKTDSTFSLNLAVMIAATSGLLFFFFFWLDVVRGFARRVGITSSGLGK